MIKHDTTETKNNNQIYSLYKETWRGELQSNCLSRETH